MHLNWLKLLNTFTDISSCIAMGKEKESNPKSEEERKPGFLRRMIDEILYLISQVF
jgi:hypothetical protein